MATSQSAPSARIVEELDQVVAGTRLVGGLIAESLANLRPVVSAAQWRVLVLASEGDCNVSAVATDLGVHRSNATRICDRLVAAELLRRRRAGDDKRQVMLELTPGGRRLFEEAMAYRRGRLAEAMALLSDDERAELARSFTRLVDAAAAVRMTARTDG